MRRRCNRGRVTASSEENAQASEADASALDGHPYRAAPATRESGPHPLLGKTTVALASMLVLLSVPYASPRLARFRVAHMPWEPPPVATTDNAVVVPAPVLVQGEQKLKASSNEATVSNALPESSAEQPAPDPALLAKTKGSLAVEDPTGHAMDAFCTQLAKTDAKDGNAVTRILHYGDSVITSDYISGTMRRKMQARFGDAGHGFILAANPWEWYFHNDVAHWASEGWTANRITGPLTGDGMYGIGGVTFHGEGGAQANFGTADKGEYGKKVSRFDIYYLEQPAGGDGMILFGQKSERFSTRGEKKVSRIKSFSVPDGEAKITLKSWGNGDLRVFGVALERDVPGVAYDALGANGARIRLWEAQNEAHWKEQMELRQPALVVLQFGTNESEDPSLNMELYEKSLHAVVKKLKVAAPMASILIAAPLDRAEKNDSGTLRTKPIILKLVDSQRRVAKEEEVAFWDTFAAMGGEGTMAKWVKASPQLASWDFTHPTPAGAEVIGTLFYDALMAQYEARRK
jgi:lysophospholipase L1-like esterase